MERGLFIGGVLICGSIAVAMLFNLTGHDEASSPSAVPAVMIDAPDVESSNREAVPARKNECQAAESRGRTPSQDARAVRQEAPDC